MWKLLRKDLILNWKALGATYLLWSALWMGLPLRDAGGDFSLGLWSGLVAVACAFLPVMVIGREDKFRAAALTCSLPVTRKDIVISRYLGGWLVAVLAAAFAVATMLVLIRMGVWRSAEPVATVPVVVLSVIGCALASIMPFVLRFGISGVIGFLVALQLVGMAVLLASALFGVDFFRAAFRSASAIASTREALGPAGFALACLAGVAALNLASCRLSIAVFRGREF